MKKLLFLVLIAIVFCTTTEEERPIEDELDMLIRLPTWEEVKNFFKRAIQWLKDNELWDPLVKLVKKGLKEAAMNLCMKTIKDENDCKSIVDFVIKNQNEA